MTNPVNPAKGAIPIGVLPRLISPAGVTSNPNVASVRKGVRIQRFVIYFPPGNNTERGWSAVGLIAFPSNGEGEIPENRYGTRNAGRNINVWRGISFLGPV